MTFGKDGALYLATGNHGKILRVADNARRRKPRRISSREETHITALAWDKDGSLLAGTSPHGYLYRVDKANHGFVLLNSGDKEIKQIAVATNGAIYVSTFVENAKSESSAGSSLSAMMISGGGGGTSDSAAKANSQPPSSAPMEEGPSGNPSGGGGPGQGGSGGSGGPSMGAIYRVDTNGFHEKFWSAPGEAIYSMILLPDGSLLAGTGDKGRIYSIADANHWKLLQKTGDGAQVSALLADAGKAKQYFRRHQPSGKTLPARFRAGDQRHLHVQGV